VHEYRHDPSARSYGLEAAEALGLPAARVLKTLVVQLDGGALAVCCAPVDAEVDLKAVAAAAGAKRAVLAEAADAERATGYVVGGISPLGQRRQLATIVDASALGNETIFVSAGRRGLEIELAPADLVRLTDAVTAAVARRR
jgi:Cys-tRNA(Pro)/Cys-tRNA(Cys) deacylase